MTTLQLERPLVFLDIEGTGVNTEEDRIVQMSVATFAAGDHDLETDEGVTPEIRTRLINPTIAIPAASTEIHGVTDAMVANEPTFAQVALDLLRIVTGCDFGGYNVVGYDLPILEAEFKRIDCTFDWHDRRIVDGFQVFVQREPRNLEAALAFYCDSELKDAHDAEADMLAAIDVAFGQTRRYGFGWHGVVDIDTLDRESRRPEWLDRTGKIHVRADGCRVFGFGKHLGKPLEDEREYVDWMLRQDFPSDTKRILREVMG